MLYNLSQGEMSAGALASALGMKLPAISQQLGILRRDGQTMFYRINDDDAVAIIELLYRHFVGAD